MIFLTTYHTMSFHDDTSKTNRDAFEEGVAYAKKNRDTIRLPCKDRIFEAGIIAALIETTERKKRNDIIG